MKKKNDNHHLLDRMAEEARQGHLSRREFMSWSIAAGMTAAGATGLWTSNAHA